MKKTTFILSCVFAVIGLLALCIFSAWSTNWGRADRLLRSDLMLKADSAEPDPSALNRDVVRTVMIDYSDPAAADGNTDKTLSVPENIRDLYLIGSNQAKEEQEYKINIVLDRRDKENPITIHLKNITVSGDVDEGSGVCLSGDVSAEVTVEIAGIVVLKGGTDAPAIRCNALTLRGNGQLTVCGGTGSDGHNGAPAVSAQELKITGGELVLRGGTGGTGKNGAMGSPGADGENGLNQVQGKKGATGGTGSDGGMGAQGGVAAIAQSVAVSGDANVTFIGGTGGAGGNGGMGGLGGTGGIGYAGVIGSAGAGNGGDGGTGGVGGTGGNGGSPLSCEKLTVKSGTVLLKNGDGGLGGTGGNGGIGGRGGDTTQWGLYCGWSGGGGSGGNGGRGGTGGKAGSLDSYIDLDIADEAEFSKENGEGGEGGAGGLGGSVGRIGRAALERPAFDSGSPGKKGAVGSHG